MNNLIKVLVLTGIAALTTNCGSKFIFDTTPSELTLVEAVEPLLPAFEVDELPIPIYFDKIESQGPNVLAVCSYRAGKPNAIKIRREKWNSAPHSMRTAILVHELGHCLLGLKHTEQPGELMGATINNSMACIANYGLIGCINRAKWIGDKSD